METVRKLAVGKVHAVLKNRMRVSFAGSSLKLFKGTASPPTWKRSLTKGWKTENAKGTGKYLCAVGSLAQSCKNKTPMPSVRGMFW